MMLACIHRYWIKLKAADPKTVVGCRGGGVVIALASRSRSQEGLDKYKSASGPLGSQGFESLPRRWVNSES